MWKHLRRATPPFGTGNQASNRPCSNNSTLVACFPHCHFPAEPAIPEASKASKVQKPVHAVELANELAMVIIGRSVMLRSGLGAGTGGQTSSLGWDKNRRQFRGKAVWKEQVERTSGKNNWDENNVNDFKTINYEKAPNDLMSSILINLCMTITCAWL